MDCRDHGDVVICHSSSGIEPVFPRPRVIILSLGFSEDPVQAPPYVPIQVNVQPRLQLTREEDRNRGVDIVEKFEVGFIEDAWVDYTAEFKTIYTSMLSNVQPQTGLIQHTYTDPGNHLVRARATFFDGEVVTELMMVSALPPPT